MSIHYIALHGMAGSVLANGSMSYTQSGDAHAYDFYEPKSSSHTQPCEMATLLERVK
jgi:hypothetical protein